MYGLMTLLHLCPSLGISTVVYKSMPSFEPFLDSILRLRINHLYLAPPLVNAFLKHPASAKYDFTNFFKSATIAAAPLDAETESAFRKLGGPQFLVSQGFGMTETAGLVTGLPLGIGPRSGSVGRLLSATEGKIIDDDGNPVAPGARGQLCVRGSQLFMGYLNNKEASRDAFDTEGYLYTGDIVEVTPDGWIIVLDRLKHIIKNKVLFFPDPHA